MGFCGDADAAMRLGSGATAGAGGGGVRRRAPPLEREGHRVGEREGRRGGEMEEGLEGEGGCGAREREREGGEGRVETERERGGGQMIFSFGVRRAFVGAVESPAAPTNTNTGGGW